MNTKNINIISLGSQSLMFGIPALLFYVLTQYFLKYFDFWGIEISSIKWFITGFLIFIPLFITAIYFCYIDGYKSKSDILYRLRLKKLTKYDIKISFYSSISVIFLTFGIIVTSKLLSKVFSIGELQTSPDFMKATVFYGWDKLYLIIWLAMFFFNIVGEEILWRGYILPRQEIKYKNKAWLVNSAFWLIFHLCFGIDLLIILLPILIILPYAVQKTQNTFVGIIIHAAVNGPAFILISLGIIS